jgi:hypothetical protein
MLRDGKPMWEYKLIMCVGNTADEHDDDDDDDDDDYGNVLHYSML